MTRLYITAFRSFRETTYNVASQTHNFNVVLIQNMRKLTYELLQLSIYVETAGNILPWKPEGGGLIEKRVSHSIVFMLV